MNSGFILMSLRAFPLNGATFLGYEYCMKHCNTRNSYDNTLCWFSYVTINLSKIHLKNLIDVLLVIEDINNVHIYNIFAMLIHIGSFNPNFSIHLVNFYKLVENLKEKIEYFIRYFIRYFISCRMNLMNFVRHIIIPSYYGVKFGNCCITV